MPKSYFDDVVAYLKSCKEPVESKVIARKIGCATETALKHLRVLRGRGMVARYPEWTSQHGYTWIYSWTG